MTTKITINDIPQSADDLARAEEGLTRVLQRDGQTPNTGHDEQYRYLNDHNPTRVRLRAGKQRDQSVSAVHAAGRWSVPDGNIFGFCRSPSTHLSNQIVTSNPVNNSHRTSLGSAPGLVMPSLL